jgi:2-polyprenyl-3-methyl-5-hydroxy-6-metoxy-1,4-benzoquinol methylase
VAGGIVRAADYNFEICKLCDARAGTPRYRLHDDLYVYTCGECGLHYINYLDDPTPGPLPGLTAEAKQNSLRYADSVLHYSAERFESKTRLVAKHIRLAGARCLDIGAGGGLFLSLLRSRGAVVMGIDPDPANRFVAQERFNIALDPRLTDDPYWQGSYREQFDVVSLWDVIEHVNFPGNTLTSAAALVKPGGLLCLDTPARDAFLYRAGELSYKVTGGRAASFLGLQYSDMPFAHKQIFASGQLGRAVQERGFSITSLRKIHELSFPYRVYLRHLLKSDPLARLASPLAAAFFAVARVTNKTILVARKV